MANPPSAAPGRLGADGGPQRGDSLRLPPLDPLRGFVAAARHLSFTRAAAELFLTQSAISRQIQTLEQALGVALFERGTRSLALTEAGARLFRQAEGWLADYAELADRLRQAGRRQPVTVTSAIGICALWLIPRLRDFQAAHPDIDVRVAADNRVLDLAREHIDLAIRYGPDPEMPAGAVRLFGEAVAPVASPQLGLERLDAATLPGVTLLEFDQRIYPWLRWDDWLAAAGLAHLRPRGVLSFSHYDQLIAAAVAGQGVAIGRLRLLDRLLEEGRLVEVAAEGGELQGRGYWLIAAPGPQRPEVARFAEWIVSLGHPG
jgi:LysR family glycine cleavage system transcriptional activator